VRAVRARIERAGVAHELRGRSLLVRDPSGNAVLIGVDPPAAGHPPCDPIGRRNPDDLASSAPAGD
jgi:hypothetical protein